MNRLHIVAIATSLAALLSACSQGDRHSSVFQHISVDNDTIAIHARSGADAIITSAGDLSIDGKAITLEDSQRALTRSYYAEVMALQADGIATGKAGAAMAGKALSTVAKGLTSGNPDAIGPEMEKAADKVAAQARNVCTRLATLKKTQEALASELPAFRPYATIRAEQVSSCSVDSASAAASGSDEATALIDAVDAQRIEEVRRLVEHGADVDAAVWDDGTALIRAAAHGNLAIVDELIRLGADVNQASRGDGNPLIAAAKGGHADVVARLVIAGADVNGVVAGDETPLINAARGGHLDVVTYLVEHGADVNKGVVADLGRWRSPLNRTTNDRIRDYLTSKGAVADRKP